MPRRFRCARLAAAVLLAVAFAGCAKNWPINEQVDGTAKLDGEPLAGVLVEFIPDVDKKVQAPISRATTDDKGHFVLMLPTEKPGAVIGKHNVVVHAGRAEGGEAAGKKAAVVPMIYSTAAKSPLKGIEVTADKHTYDLALTVKGAATEAPR